MLVYQRVPLWKMMEFVSRDYEIPNWMESHNPFMFQTSNHQPAEICIFFTLFHIVSPTKIPRIHQGGWPAGLGLLRWIDGGDLQWILQWYTI